MHAQRPRVSPRGTPRQHRPLPSGRRPTTVNRNEGNTTTRGGAVRQTWSTVAEVPERAQGCNAQSSHPPTTGHSSRLRHDLFSMSSKAGQGVVPRLRRIGDPQSLRRLCIGGLPKGRPAHGSPKFAAAAHCVQRNTPRSGSLSPRPRPLMRSVRRYLGCFRCAFRE